MGLAKAYLKGPRGHSVRIQGLRHWFQILFAFSQPFNWPTSRKGHEMAKTAGFREGFRQLVGLTTVSSSS
jgi:hypothetical protein